MSKQNMNKTYRSFILLIFCLLMFTALNGCGTGPDASTTPTPTPTPTPIPIAASINLLATPTTVKSDGITFATITIRALNAAHALLPGINVTMSADTGVLEKATITTGSDGTATVKFYCDNDPTNRTATITATAGAVSAQTLVRIVGSKIMLTPSGTIALSSSGSPTATLIATVSDAVDNPVANTPVTITRTGTGSVTVTPVPASATTTDSSGKFTATIEGVAAGTVTLTVTALGTTATAPITVSAAAASFGIDKQWLNSVDIGNPKPTAMKIGDNLAIEVNAPSVTTVVFVTTIGSWVGGTTSREVTVAGGKAIATLTTTLAGIANVQVYDKDHFSTSDALTVAMTSSAAAANIVLQATSSVVPISVGTTTGTSTLIATARDATVPTGFLVAGVPISFSIVNPTGGGESIYPVVKLTGYDGKASTTFSSGSVSSDPAGVKIRASVVGTAVATGTIPSGSDASIIIGGTAGSVAFGQATSPTENDNKSQYILPMSILVADSSGHAVAGARVSLNLWPRAWSTGINCRPDPDASRCDYSEFPYVCVPGNNYGTFWSEDINANLILDAGEDGLRNYYATGLPAPGVGTADGFLTPVNSDAGTLPPGDIYTDTNGVAAFNLTYPKGNAIWTIIRIRASTVVQGSETVGEIIFRLPYMLADIIPSCKLPDSHYVY